MKKLFLISLLVVAASMKAEFYAGADFSWLTEQESKGVKFYDETGKERDCVELLGEYSISAARFRVWVNPADSWCDKEDVVAKAIRASRAGMKIMIDFHYSDSWADPSKQTIPAGWENYDISQMCTAVYNHTAEVLTALKEAGITVDWVQIGNETRNGMLWNMGSIDNKGNNGDNFAWLVNSGNDAAKSVFPEAQTIVHVDNGWDRSLYDYVFGYLKTHEARYDMIGMSLYPVDTYTTDDPAVYFRTSEWKTKADLCIANVKYVAETYGKRVMICETGMPNAYTKETLDAGQTWEQRCSKDAFEYISYLLPELQETGVCEGIFYWEPQCYNNWQNYAMGAFTGEGKPNGYFEALRSLLPAQGSVAQRQCTEKLIRISGNMLEATADHVEGIRLYDMAGSMVRKGSGNTLDMAGLAPGIYLASAGMATVRIALR